MPVMRCKSCNEVCMPDAELNPVKVCGNCGSTDLVCDHPGSDFNRERQCFMCSWCGEEQHSGLTKIRKLALERPELGLQNLVDTKTH